MKTKPVKARVMWATQDDLASNDEHGFTSYGAAMKELAEAQERVRQLEVYRDICNKTILDDNEEFKRLESQLASAHAKLAQAEATITETNRYIEEQHAAGWRKIQAVLPEPDNDDQRSLVQRVIDAITAVQANEDTARLDWLDIDPYLRMEHVRRLLPISPSAPGPGQIRAAIDAARSAAQAKPLPCKH